MIARLARDRYAPLLVPAGVLILAVFAYPVFWLLIRSFSDPSWGFQNYQTVFAKTIYLKVIWNTVAIAGATTIGALLLGYPMAYSMVNSSPLIRRLLIFVVLIPFWTSILVRTFAWMVLLQSNGILNDVLIGVGLIETPVKFMFNRTGVLIGMIQIMLPFMVFPLYSVMSRIDHAYLQAAANLGARPIKSFFRVYLPLSAPGVVTGSMLVFIISLGYFITPALLGGRKDVMIAQLSPATDHRFRQLGAFLHPGGHPPGRDRPDLRRRIQGLQSGPGRKALTRGQGSRKSWSV